MRLGTSDPEAVGDRSRVLSRRNLLPAAALAAAALFVANCSDGGDKKERSKVDNPITRSAGKVSAEKQPPSTTIPTSIPKDRVKKPTNLKKAPGYNEFPPVKPDEFINVDFQSARKHIERENKEYGCSPIHTVPSVAVYTELDGKPIELRFSYFPGYSTFQGSEMLDLPEGTDAERLRYYAFFDGGRRELDATVTSPDPAREPEFRDDITLTIPSDIEFPEQPTCSPDGS